MPAVYMFTLDVVDYVTLSLVYGEYLVNVHFSDILHTFIPHFTLHSAEKNPHRNFRKLPVDNFPHSAIRKIPLPKLSTQSRRWHPRVVQSVTCLVRELTSPRDVQSANRPVRELAIASWRIRELSSNHL